MILPINDFLYSLKETFDRLFSSFKLLQFKLRYAKSSIEIETFLFSLLFTRLATSWHLDIRRNVLLEGKKIEERGGEAFSVKDRSQDFSMD